MSAPSSSSAFSLDAIVHQIKTTSNPGTVNGILRNIPRDVRDIVLIGPLAGDQDPLHVLDVRVHTLGVLYILAARLNSTASPLPSLAYIQDFVVDFVPEHARYSPENVTLVAKGIVRLAELAGCLKLAIEPLFQLLTRFSPTLSTLTTIHPIFLSICLQTGHPAAALPVLAHPISHLGHDLNYNDNLLFHYAGGMVLAMLKRWKEAEECFEICVSAPAQHPAALQMEALKKLVCVQLISKGKTIPPPKYTNGHLMRIFKTTPYNTFMNSYPDQIPTLNSILDKERALFTNDRTLGLLLQALDRAPRWRIKKLTGTYLTLGLSEIGNLVGITDLDEVRGIILSMIESSEISAQISASDIVTFSDITPQFSQEDVERVLRDAEDQANMLKRLEMELGRSREYLNKAVKSKEDIAWGSLQDDETVFGSAPAGAWVDEPTFSG